ncbi:MAG TPA: NAD-dependent epimerase/dehydratase family protein [Ilumatobacter sp.]|nr:NAD-dependent epimerase/dehydratase family protein [Ilumatobacter sp.]
MASAEPLFPGWAGTTCLVTGGLGFIGSNVVGALVASGAKVRVVDALVPGHGGRRDQLDHVEVDELLIASIDHPTVGDLLEGVDAVFNVAGQVSHTASMSDPHTDMALNATAQIGLLDQVLRVAPQARLVYTSTRQVYGRSAAAITNETHLPRPVDVNGVAKLAGEQLHLVYTQAYGLAASALRLTNVYGPRQCLTSNELGFLPVFVRKAMQGETIEIYGDGLQQRDCVHVDDVVAALITAAEHPAAVGNVFNAGHRFAHPLREIASIILAAAGRSDDVVLVPWPDEHARINIGSFHTGTDLIRDELGWSAGISLSDGIADTLAFYRGNPWFLSST